MNINEMIHKSVKPIKELMNGFYMIYLPHKTYKQGYVAVKFLIAHCEVCGKERAYYWEHYKRFIIVSGWGEEIKEAPLCKGASTSKKKSCRIIYEQGKRIHKPQMYNGRLITIDNVPDRVKNRNYEPIAAYIRERKQALTPESKKKRVKANKNLKSLKEWKEFEAKSTKDTLKEIKKIKSNGDIFYCYTIKNTHNNKVYIGITNNYKRRKRQHKSVMNRKTSKQYYSRLYCSMRKYGFDSFKWTIVKTSDSYLDICKYEINLIAKLDSMNEENGYNMSKGGSGAYGAVRSKETKAKLSAITKKQMTPEARAHLSLMSKKNWQDPEYRKRHALGQRVN